MRNLTAVLLLMLMLYSCGPYQKVLKEDDVKAKYEMANSFYEEATESGSKTNYRKAIRLLEQILPQFSGKPQGERVSYIYANSYYNIKDYFDAAYQFERFVRSYPNSEKAEEAAFKEAKSYYYISPRYSLDQTETEKAITKFQEYLSKYPAGSHIAEANQLVAELQEKLERKSFKIAELYYFQDDYKAAVASLNNFINENPGSEYREQAYFYKLDAEYELAINSFQYIMEERLRKAKTYAEDYLKYFPEGKYLDKTRTILEDAEKRLTEF